LPHHDLDRFPLLLNFVYFAILVGVHGVILGLAACALGSVGRIARRNSP
jgi:hypothetical protein